MGFFFLFFLLVLGFEIWVFGSGVGVLGLRLGFGVRGQGLGFERLSQS